MSSVDASETITSRMTSHIGDTKNSQGGFREKLFRPQSLDIEQIILHMIDAISLSALMVRDVGNASEANAVFSSLVLNLDAFVFPLLTSEKFVDWTEYIEDREVITKKWAEQTKNRESPVSSAYELYTHTIKILSTQRLFKVRRMSYFGVGWKKAQTAGRHPKDKKMYEALSDGNSNIPETLLNQEEDEDFG